MHDSHIMFTVRKMIAWHYGNSMLITGYAALAYAGGDKELQAHRWPTIKARLALLEANFPGITVELLKAIEELKHENIFSHLP